MTEQCTALQAELDAMTPKARALRVADLLRRGDGESVAVQIIEGKRRERGTHDSPDDKTITLVQTK